jgi:hypothetical protein
MTTFADLELELAPKSGREDYTVQVRFSEPGGETWTASAVVYIDLGAVVAARGNLDKYTRLLSQGFFTAEVKEAYARARSSAAARGLPLRVRLATRPEVGGLVFATWELLRDPIDSSFLVQQENIIFSRYWSSPSGRPPRLRARHELRALIVIASPDDLSRYRPGGQQLLPVNVSMEQELARAALQGMTATALVSRGQATPENLIRELREGYDLLYLVCHGTIIEGELQLWLEDESGRASLVEGARLAAHFGDLERPPTLVVLSSCQSASTAQSSDGGALAIWGPDLIEAGVPAVAAMQSTVTRQTVEEFWPVFFRELQQDGQVDRAMAEARRAILHRDDWWAPVLFTSLRRGNIWTTPRFDVQGEGAQAWQALLSQLARGRCIPVLGPGIAEPVFGPVEAIARDWAEEFAYPFPLSGTEDLLRVARFLDVAKGRQSTGAALQQYLRAKVAVRYRDALAEVFPLDKLPELSLEEQLTALADWCWRRGDVHALLASLPLPLYLTANWDRLLESTLTVAGKQPHARVLPWWDEPPDGHAADEGAEPEPHAPLVYHVLGRLEDAPSLVLTEDDLFAYLQRAPAAWRGATGSVAQILAEGTFLFLGFAPEDWRLQALLHTLPQRPRGLTHLAVLDPLQERTGSDPERTARYMERSLEGWGLRTYWGSAEDFLRELLARWRGRAGR